MRLTVTQRRRRHATLLGVAFIAAQLLLVAGGLAFVHHI